jgi:hypothetical protein
MLGLSAQVFCFKLPYRQQDRQCPYNVTLRNVHVTIVAEENY